MKAFDLAEYFSAPVLSRAGPCDTVFSACNRFPLRLHIACCLLSFFFDTTSFVMCLLTTELESEFGAHPPPSSDALNFPGTLLTLYGVTCLAVFPPP